MEDSKLPKDFLAKERYEAALAKFLQGCTNAGTIAFVIGKLVGYFGFLSWWYLAAPLGVCLFGALINYLEWVPNRRILLYTIGFVYGTLRYAIIRLILWMPILMALFTAACIQVRYPSANVFISIVALLATWLFVSYFSGRSPGMPTKV